MTLTIIVAIADDRAIGRQGDLLYHISEDLRHFKKLTLGKPVIMGRKTFDSLPKGALPGRMNIVVTRNAVWNATDVVTSTSLEDAISIAENSGASEAFIIGGSQIYSEALRHADALEITRIYAPARDADTFFPSFEEDWERTSAEPMSTDPQTGYNYQFCTYRRKNN